MCVCFAYVCVCICITSSKMAWPLTHHILCVIGSDSVDENIKTFVDTRNNVSTERLVNKPHTLRSMFVCWWKICWLHNDMLFDLSLTFTHARQHFCLERIEARCIFSSIGTERIDGSELSNCVVRNPIVGMGIRFPDVDSFYPIVGIGLIDC